LARRSGDEEVVGITEVAQLKSEAEREEENCRSPKMGRRGLGNEHISGQNKPRRGKGGKEFKSWANMKSLSPKQTES